MAGLDPAIPAAPVRGYWGMFTLRNPVDGRIKSGHDIVSNVLRELGRLAGEIVAPGPGRAVLRPIQTV